MARLRPFAGRWRQPAQGCRAHRHPSGYVVPLAPSLDCVGPLARSARDVAQALKFAPVFTGAAAGSGVTGLSDNELLAKLSAQEAFGRPAEVWEVANVMIFLASDLASYMTGEILSVSSQRA
jgi:NAD(P)-dependent dehydrogenase (short-subunit alcohol dehydrogenase family)